MLLVTYVAQEGELIVTDKGEYQINIKLVEGRHAKYEDDDLEYDACYSLEDLDNCINGLINVLKEKIYDDKEDSIEDILYTEGYQKAEKRGKKKVKKIIKNLLKEGMPIKEIAKVTNYSEEEILNIKHD